VLENGPGPLRRAIDYAAPRLIAPRLPELVAGYADGRVFHLPADQGPYSQVFTLGEFEPGESSVMRRLVRQGDLAVDVGANLGWFSLVLAAAGAEVWAIEPMPAILPALKRNLALNPSLGIELHEVALGAEEGELDLHVFAGLPHGHASASTLGRSDFTAHRVRVTTLDRLLAGAPPPALVKLDVEGSERDVLLGARQTLAAEEAPAWVIEVNYETASAFGYRPTDLLELAGEHNDYTVYRIERQELCPEPEPEHAPNGSNWILVPAARLDRAL
jgi:FkbM family methyltransferase